jgi:hypothetical protein
MELVFCGVDSRRSERGFASVSTLLVLGAVGVLLFALFGAAATEPDRYGRLPVPSTAYVSLPEAESSISWVSPDGSAPPSDLRIVVLDPGAGAALRVNSNGGESVRRDREWLKPIGRVDPPHSGVYQVRATSARADLAPGSELAFGETAVGAVGDRFSEVGTLLTGPAGIAAGVLLVGALLAPGVRRSLRRARRATRTT